MAEPRLRARSPYEDAPLAFGSGRGVVAVERDPLAMAAVLVRKDQSAALQRRVTEWLGIKLPEAPRVVSNGEIRFVHTGPEAWLVTREPGETDLCQLLQQRLAPLVSITDQSGGASILCVSGPCAGATLSKLVPVDIHPRVFRVGDVATTRAAHVGITLIRSCDDDQVTPAFEVIVARSLARSFWLAFQQSAAEFGLVRIARRFTTKGS
jgi:heterotetrameric sarcosine oxidase gamma subunit